MEETGFAPCVNWNKGRILDCMDADHIMYGFKNNVVVITWNADGYKSKVIFSAHDDRVIAVAAAPHTAAESLQRTFASCGNDGYLRLWNVDTLSLIKAHNSHLSKNSPTVCEVIDLSWSRANPNLIVSLGKNNCLIAWHVAENVTYKYSLRNIHGRAISCCPTDATLVAVSDGGVINIVKLSKANCKITKFRIFDQEIVDFAWQPDVIKPIMAVTSKRGELLFFNTFQAKRCAKPIKIDFINQKVNDNNAFIFFPVLWKDSNTVFTRSSNQLISLDFKTKKNENGEIEHCVENSLNWRNSDNVSVGVKNGKEKGSKWSVLHKLHRRDFFVLCTSSQGGLVWTVGSDRALIGFNLTTGKPDRFISTLFAGAICCFVSPHDPNIIAFGGGDGCLRIWNVNEPTGTIITETRNVQDSVMCLCWHPELENILLFGTSTGRIGFIDVTKGKPATLLPPASSKSVYWLTWGPPFYVSSPEEKKKFVLYAISNKTLYVYSQLESTNRPHNLGNELLLPCKGVSDMAWKPDNSLFALGATNGDIYIMKPACSVPVLTLNVRSQVQYLAWHPPMTTTDSQLSPYHNLLTCGSICPEGVIKVFKIEEEEETGLRSSVFATLNGHHDYVQSVAWNPHISGQLVSSSADMSIQIWDALTETPLTNHQPTPGFLSYYAIWSPVNSDYIISGSKENSVHVWKISNQIGKVPIKTDKKLKRFNQNNCEMAEDRFVASSKERKETNKNQESCPPAPVSMPVQINTTKLVSGGDMVVNSVVNGWSRHADSFDVCYQLLKADSCDKEKLHSNFLFSSDDDISQKIVKLEKSHHVARNDNILGSLMLYQGRLKELIEQRIEDGNLNESLVGLAPSVSPRLWQQACIAYARQLRAKLQFSTAANYLLACRNVEDAIEVLIEGNLYNEALYLARTQLPNEDGSFTNILRKYATYLIRKGNFAKATECFIYLNDLTELQACLARSCDVMALCCAAYLAKKSGNTQLRVELTITALSMAIQNNLSNVIGIIATDHQDLQVVKLMHNAYTSLLLPANDGDIPLLKAVSSDINDTDLKECHSQILNAIPKQTSNGVHDKTWNVIQELCLAVSAPTDVVKCRHVLRALEITHLQGSSELCSLCQHLSPGLSKEGVFNAENGQGISLKGFLCIALLHKSSIDLDNSQIYFNKIIDLQKYLLDELSFDYYRTKTRINSLQSKISNKSSESKGELELIVNERNKLVLSISKIELERCVVPNPVAGFMLLRSFYSNLENVNIAAKEQLEVISNQCIMFMK